MRYPNYDTLLKDRRRLDKIQAAGIKSTRKMFGAKCRVGWIVSEEGDVLAGTIVDYPYSTLRKAIDAMKAPK